jgi:hypothetical protein
MQYDAIAGAHREGGFAKVAFPARAFNEVTDFKIEPAFEPV